MKATFENSVNVLLQAYLRDELEHLNCRACAVGNLIAHANGYRYTSGLFGWIDKNGNKVEESWFDSIIGVQTKESWSQCKSTGYSIPQVRKIERAFEEADQGKSVDDWMFNGLMAVIDVLAEIHNIDLSVKEEYKNPFIKQYELLTNA